MENNKYARYPAIMAEKTDMIPIVRVSEHLLESLSTTYRLCRSGELRAKKIRGRWYVNKYDLADYLD